jgi:ribosomal 50S subunit-associated protein YjgA (DUF615 family)
MTRTFTAAAALAAAVAVSAAVHRYRRLHRTLARERAAHRITDGCLHRDVAAFQTRIDGLLAQQEDRRAVLAEAGQVVDDALATHHTNRPHTEGGPG